MAYMVYKVSGKNRKIWYVSEERDFSNQFCTIPKDKLKPGKVKIDTYEFVITKAAFSDKFHAMKRSAQIITRKDIGYIIAYCALGKESVVVETGAGSGGATVMLARVCKEVHSFDNRKDHIERVEKNLAKLEIKNVTIKEQDAYENIPAKDADMVLLDLPEPWNAVKNAAKATVSGGFIVIYTPTIMQANEFFNSLPEDVFHERTVEVIDREWNVRGRAVRPGNTPIGHTAFLTFCRKL